jgi:type I restriction enzyme S subunit
MIQRFEIPKPPLQVQQEIATILSRYDDLIENNRKRMFLLEESARLLYQEWFVHLRFPSHERARVVNGLPQGWRQAKYSEFVDFLEGPGLRNYQYRDAGIPFLNIRTIQDDDIDFAKVQYLDESEVESRYSHFLLAEDDHVVSSSGTLGRVATVRASHLPVMLNTSIIRMRPKSFMTKWFLKAYLKHGDYLDQVTAMATGAAQLNYGPSHLGRLNITIPSEPLMKLFDEYASQFYMQIKVLQDCNQKLKVSRDILLPRLMSGEIAV